MKPRRIVSSFLGITAMLGLLCCDPGSVDKPGVDGGLPVTRTAAPDCRACGASCEETRRDEHSAR